MEKSGPPLFSHKETKDWPRIAESQIILCDYFYKAKLSGFNDQIMLILTDTCFAIC